jgi:hypothetical protein
MQYHSTQVPPPATTTTDDPAAAAAAIDRYVSGQPSSLVSTESTNSASNVKSVNSLVSSSPVRSGDRPAVTSEEADLAIDMDLTIITPCMDNTIIINHQDG